MSNSEKPDPAAPTPPRPDAAPEREFGHGVRIRDIDQSIESELEAAMAGMSERELYGDPAERQKKPAGGEPGKKAAKVVAVHQDSVFVDVPGGRTQGILPLAQFPEGPPAIGSSVDVHIEGYDKANGLLLVSRQGAAISVDWSSVAEGQVVEARVTEANKGGLTVDVNGIRGFLPISQIDLYRVEDTQPFINQRLHCQVTEVNPGERNLVVSRRALLEKEREENREKLWQVLEEGQVREGVVRSVRDFGAFVDLGGVDGLLHISQMSWKRVQNPSEIVQPGQRVKVAVLKIDREQRKLSLGLRQLQTSPWEQAAVNYPPNTMVKGKVTRLMDFGAFVEIEPGIEGLIHISELAPQKVRRVGDVVQQEQEVNVMVLRVDTAQQKMSLSLKAAQAKQSGEATESATEETPSEPPRPQPKRTTPLRGGIGD